LSRPFYSRPFQSREPKHRRNGKIRAREVRVLDEEKKQLGVMTLTEALSLAQSKGLDLVEIAPTATPPVCRIVNSGRLMYEEAKSHKESRQAGAQMKEIQLRPGIEAHDLETKLNHAREFLEDGSLVKVALRFRGRELRHPERGLQVVEKFIAELAAFGNTDAPPKRVERNIHVMLRPLPKQQRGKAPAREQTKTGPAIAPAPPQTPPTALELPPA
jgi:translation initiation factor IF-3